MIFNTTRFLAALLSLVTLCFPNGAEAASLKTQNVFLIISDGFRWQEVFNGAAADLMTEKEGGVRDPKALRAEFWRQTPEARREALLPFIWSSIARNGQILGNRAKDSLVSVTNGKKFSYPGYNEIFTGYGDPEINSNDKMPNPNVNVFEWLNGRPGLRGRVAVFGTWDVFPHIFSVERSHLPIWPAWESRFSACEIRPPEFVTELRRDTTEMWHDLTYDSLLLHAAVDHVKQKRPRLMFVGFGETDEWVHSGRYDLYLQAAHHVDEFVTPTVGNRSIHESVSREDHLYPHGRSWSWQRTARLERPRRKSGRSGGRLDRCHRPGYSPAGERTEMQPLGESQIAATIAALLGEDYHTAFPRSGAPISELMSGRVAPLPRR